MFRISSNNAIFLHWALGVYGSDEVAPWVVPGSPLSEALCLMVVSISEQIWPINFKEILANHNLFVRHLRYVDNRLILGNHPI